MMMMIQMIFLISPLPGRVRSPNGPEAGSTLALPHKYPAQPGRGTRAPVATPCPLWASSPCATGEGSRARPARSLQGRVWPGPAGNGVQRRRTASTTRCPCAKPGCGSRGSTISPPAAALQRRGSRSPPAWSQRRVPCPAGPHTELSTTKGTSPCRQVGQGCTGSTCSSQLCPVCSGRWPQWPGSSWPPCYQDPGPGPALWLCGSPCQWIAEPACQ